ncbi:MAG: hypothetical protein AAGE86_07725, partial [Pseudomonadota bacterium]
MEEVRNPPLIRGAGAILAAVAALAMIPAFGALFFGIMEGWPGILYGLVLFSCAAFNFVISSEVYGNSRRGEWLLLVVALSGA